MAVPNTSVNKALKKGIQTIYRELFQYIYIRFMDEEKTLKDDVYEESERKVYQKPIRLLGHFSRERVVAQDSVRVTEEKEFFKIPVAEFEAHGIKYTSVEDLDKLRKAVIQMKGLTYQIDEVNPTSMVAGDFLVVRFDASPMKDYIADEYDRLRMEIGDSYA